MSRMLKWLFIVLLLLPACMPDRYPPAPVEITRPKFITFNENDAHAYAVPLTDPIAMIFDEPMDAGLFCEGFTLYSQYDVISGTFAAQESTVIFTPSQQMREATLYHAEITGVVKDAHGNSMSIESDYKVSTWFLTAGDYSQNGFYKVYVTDGISGNHTAYIIEDFINYTGTISDFESPSYITTSPDGSKLFVLNNISNGVVSVFNTETDAKMFDIAVGKGPTDIAITQTYSYVVNRSDRTVSVIDNTSNSVIHTISFTNNFKPRNIAVAPTSNKIFLSSNDNQNKGLLKILNATDYSEDTTLTDVVTSQRSIKMAVSANENYVYILEDKTNYVAVLDIATLQVVDPIYMPTAANIDIRTYGDYAYICVSESNLAGGVYKIDVNSNAIVDSTLLDSGCEGLDLTPMGEILYVATPNDSSLTIIETGEMQVIRNPKVSQNVQTVAVCSKKY